MPPCESLQRIEGTQKWHPIVKEVKDRGISLKSYVAAVFAVFTSEQLLSVSLSSQLGVNFGVRKALQRSKFLNNS